MKTFNVIEKKSGQLVLSFITYDKRIEDNLLKQVKKIKRKFDVVEVKQCEKKI